MQDSRFTLPLCFVQTHQNSLSGKLESDTEESSHPPHLKDSKGRLMPKALVPLCSYHGTMIGKSFENFTLCDKFQQSVLNGQLCYSLNLKEGYSFHSKNGEKNSLTLVLDQPTNMGNIGEDAIASTIHLDQIGSHTDNRPGKYYMTDLKKMTGTDAFMALSNSEKRCQAESYQDCKNGHFFATLKQECKCVPFKLAWFQEVSLLKKTQIFNTIPSFSIFLSVAPWKKDV